MIADVIQLMKTFRISLRLLLGAVVIISVVLAIDRKLAGDFEAYKAKLESEHVDVGMTFVGFGWNFDKTGKEMSETTSWLDRMLFRRRLHAKFISVTQNNGAMLCGNTREVKCSMTPFGLSLIHI